MVLILRSSTSSYSFIWGCQTQPTTYGTKNRCRHIHGHTHNTCSLKYIYTHSRTVFSSSYYGWCRLEMREKRGQCSSKQDVNKRCVTRKPLSKCNNCHVSLCFKFSGLCFGRILFESVDSWETDRNKKNRWAFYETQYSNFVCTHQLYVLWRTHFYRDI